MLINARLRVTLTVKQLVNEYKICVYIPDERYFLIRIPVFCLRYQYTLLVRLLFIT